MQKPVAGPGGRGNGGCPRWLKPKDGDPLAPEARPSLSLGDSLARDSNAYKVNQTIKLKCVYQSGGASIFLNGKKLADIFKNSPIQRLFQEPHEKIS